MRKLTRARRAVADKAEDARLLGLLLYTSAREFVADNGELVAATLAGFALLLVVFSCL